MNEELELILEDAGERMDSSITHFEKALTKIRAGKASPMMLDGVMVEYYGTPTALDKVANVMCPDARTITVKPWEKSLLNVIDKAILISNLGFTPAKAELETAKINIRNIRKDANNAIRRTEDASEDLMKQYEEQVQTLTDKYVARAEAIMEEKEKDIMTVA